MRVLHRLFTTFFVGALLLLSSISIKADSIRIITVDENGHGTFGLSTAPASMSPDPGPGGLSSALSYFLHNPPALVQGDVIILDSSGVVSDIIRFNELPGVRCDLCFDFGFLLFYSRPGGGALADTGFPTANYANVLTVTEVNGEVVYTPTAGQPGFVGAAVPFAVTYIIKSDPPIPEPATIVLLVTGLVGIAKLQSRHSPSPSSATSE